MWEQFLIARPIICSSLFRWCHGSNICTSLINEKSRPSAEDSEPIITFTISPS